MTYPITLEDLINHTFEEIEIEGRRRGIYKKVTPRIGIIRNVFNYSRTLYIHRSNLIGTRIVVLN
ncbi:MAG: hypothetical protein NT175_13530 [Bacteroidetes bacterium]|nr:hypothetical protein [Bacteroidota bacterium]